MPAVAARGGAGHRAKPVLNALLNFTKLRRAVNHLGGSTRLGCCSCRIWLAQVPAEFLRWDLPADPFPSLPTIVLRITYYPNPDTRFNPSSLSAYLARPSTSFFSSLDSSLDVESFLTLFLTLPLPLLNRDGRISPFYGLGVEDEGSWRFVIEELARDYRGCWIKLSRKKKALGRFNERGMEFIVHVVKVMKRV